MSDRLHAAAMPRLDAFDQEFGHDPAAAARARRRRIVRRIATLAALALGAGIIAALALAWPMIDRPLRLDLQSSATPPQSAARDGSQEEIDRLRREVDALASELGELRQALRQASDTIATLQAAGQKARERPPSPLYWYSNPQALSFEAARPPPPGAVPTPLPRPPTARRESRGARPGDRPAPSSSQVPQ